MTYRELVEICNWTPDCMECKYRQECGAFNRKTAVEYPCDLYRALFNKFDFDKEIEVEE